MEFRKTPWSRATDNEVLGKNMMTGHRGEEQVVNEDQGKDGRVSAWGGLKEPEG